MSSRWLVAALTHKQSGLTPAARYVLARFVQLHGVWDWTPLGVSEFAKTIGISDSQLGRGLNALVDGGVLWRRSVAEGVGRPSSEYCLAPGVVDQFENCEVDDRWAKCINRLLRHENYAGRKSVGHKKEAAGAVPVLKAESTRLSFSNRLLFAVLLCHADRFGVVETTGRSALGQQVGLSKTDLRYRTQVLLDNGVLRSYVPGAPRTGLFEKMPSRYVLNLNHPDLAAEVTPLLVTIVDPHLDDAVDAVLHSPQGDQDQRDLGKSIRRLFSSPHMQMQGAMLRSKLDSYAQVLLTTHWGNFERGCLHLRRALRQELLTTDAGGAMRDSPEARRSRFALSHYLVNWAACIASSIQRPLKGRVTGAHLSSMDIVLLPETKVKSPSYGAPFYCSRTLLLLPKGGVAASAIPACGGYVIEKREGNWTETTYADPALLSVHMQCYLGLRVPTTGVLQLAELEPTCQWHWVELPDVGSLRLPTWSSVAAWPGK